MSVTHGGNIFEIARERGWDWREVADFSASINPLGPSPAVFDAIRAALDRIQHYPDREPAGLRRALAQLWNVDEAQILLGNGATELLHWLRAREPAARRHAGGARILRVLSRVSAGPVRVRPTIPTRWPREGLLVLTQPNNPTGAALPPEALEAMATAHDATRC